MEKQITIQSYKLSELWKMYGSDRTYRTFQKRRTEFVEVLMPGKHRYQKRYLADRESKIIKLLPESI